MASLHYLSNSAIPIPREQAEQMLEAITTMQRETAIMAGWLIAHMDRQDGNPDIEANGDERDGSLGEDDFAELTGYGPGCPIADPGGCEHDGREIDDGH